MDNNSNVVKSYSINKFNSINFNKNNNNVYYSFDGRKWITFAEVEAANDNLLNNTLNNQNNEIFEKEQSTYHR